jgi:uncharacterized protein YndB with AHSA1/START domain
MADDIYTIERSITIAAPAERIYEQIADFHQWPEWSPWEGVDKHVKRIYAGPESGTGAKYSWSGNRRAGLGQMEITQAIEPSAVLIDLEFVKPFRARNDIQFRLLPDPESPSDIHVTWTMTGKKSLITRLVSMFSSMDKLVGPDFERGLAQLKTRAEAPPAS